MGIFKTVDRRKANNIILLTGVTSSFGQQVLQDLSKENDVICLVRDKKSAILNSHKMRVIQANLLNEGELIKAVKNIPKIDIILHMAGITYTGKMKNKGLFKDNEGMAENIGKLASEKKVKKIVFISSNSVNYSQRSYAVSKRNAEKILTDTGIPIIIVRPTLILGKNSAEIDHLIGMITKTPIVPMLFEGKTKMQPVNDTDLCKFIAIIIKRNVNKSEIYTIAGSKVIDHWEFATKVMQSRKIRRWLIKVPNQISNLILWLMKVFTGDKFQSIKESLTIDLVEDTTPARRLGWKPKDQILV